jgi:RNase H-fold protein (predicted Holliday junction resolvase)
MNVLGIDPGTHKCGYALINGVQAKPLTLGIVAPMQLASTLDEVSRRFSIDVVALGAGTSVVPVRAVVQGLGVPIHLVDEKNTTYLARARFFADHPPRGWKRLIPRGMLVPDQPLDDYAALLIAERYIGTVMP